MIKLKTNSKNKKIKGKKRLRHAWTLKKTLEHRLKIAHMSGPTNFYFLWDKQVVICPDFFGKNITYGLVRH
jgi:hypothetical protein